MLRVRPRLSSLSLSLLLFILPLSRGQVLYIVLYVVLDVAASVGGCFRGLGLAGFRKCASGQVLLRPPRRLLRGPDLSPSPRGPALSWLAPLFGGGSQGPP